MKIEDGDGVYLIEDYKILKTRQLTYEKLEQKEIISLQKRIEYQSVQSDIQKILNVIGNEVVILKPKNDHQETDVRWFIHGKAYLQSNNCLAYGRTNEYYYCVNFDNTDYTITHVNNCRLYIDEGDIL